MPLFIPSMTTSTICYGSTTLVLSSAVLLLLYLLQFSPPRLLSEGVACAIRAVQGSILLSGERQGQKLVKNASLAHGQKLGALRARYVRQTPTRP